jgi:hypothetical protein
MPVLVACLGSGKGSWSNINRIISSGMFDKVNLVTDSFGKNNYTPVISTKSQSFILETDFSKPIEELVADVYSLLKKNFSEQKMQDLDIALNLCSGAGKEHEAILSSVLKLGYGIRLIDLDSKGNIVEL